jgi:hypothetical protein
MASKFASLDLRTKEGSTDGLFFGVKEGTNGKEF